MTSTTARTDIETQKMDSDESESLRTGLSNSSPDCTVSKPEPVVNGTHHSLASNGDSDFHFGKDVGDVVIEAGGRRFTCHKQVLVQHGLYFEAMFASGMKESQLSEIRLENIAPEPLHGLLDYFYTGRLDLSPSNVREMTEVCSHLQVTAALDQCCDLLLTLIEDDLCLSLMRLANRHMLPEVYNQSRRHALWHFPRVYQTEDFTSAPCSQVVDYLQDPHLNMDSEMEVWRAAAVWYCAQQEPCAGTHPEEFFGQVVNFHLVDQDQVDLLMEDVPGVGEHPALAQFVALLSQEDVLARLRSKDPTRVRTSPRSGSVLCVGAHQCSDPVCGASCSLVSQKQNAPLEVMRFEPEDCSLHHVASLSDHYPPLAYDSGYRVCAVGHLVYVVGGESMMGRTGGWLKEMWCLDTLRESWHLAGTQRKMRRHHGMCVHGATLYLIGGVGRFRMRLESTESFDTETKEWRTLPDMLHQETSPAVMEHRGVIYVLKNYTQVFDIATSTWSFVRLPPPVPGLPVCAYPHPDPHNNSIFISCFNSESLWVVNRDKKESKLATKFKREGRVGVLCGGRFYHFEVNDPRTESDTHVECYDVEGGCVEQTGVLTRTMVTANFVVVPHFPRYAPSTAREFY
ncbi:hypothetical protein ACOMHN_013486 [Nucella lapillus]